LSAGAEVSRLGDGASPAICTRIGGAEVYPDLAETPPPAWPAVALVVVEKLDAVSGAWSGTRLGEALVDVALATLAGEACGAEAFKGAHSVHTLASIEAGVLLAIVHIHLAEFSLSARRT
jgi:hypothetical protein